MFLCTSDLCFLNGLNNYTPKHSLQCCNLFPLLGDNSFSKVKMRMLIASDSKDGVIWLRRLLNNYIRSVIASLVFDSSWYSPQMKAN